MAALQLSAAFSISSVTRPLFSGEVEPEGIAWNLSAIHPSEMFWRQLRFGDFDVSEMSLASLHILTAQGNKDWVALPVFTSRRFFHTGIVVREGVGIETPGDLRGRRVGVPEYQQTAAVWTRGALLHEFGVAPEDLRWFMERLPSRSHGGSTRFSPPPGLEFSYIDAGTNIGGMLEAGDLDAAIVYIVDSNLVDRSRRDVESTPGLRYLFADRIAEGVRYYRATGLLPVNHCVVVRADIVRSHPWVALNVYAAFVRAKEQALSQVADSLAPWMTIGAVGHEMSAAVRAVDPLPYGLAGQRRVLRTLADYLAEQHLADRVVDAEEVFAPSTLDL